MKIATKATTLKNANGHHCQLGPGAAIAHSRGLAGTLGAMVRSQVDGRIGALSNWHVLAYTGAPLGAPIVWHQPDPTVQFPLRKRHRLIGQLGPSLLDQDGDAAVAWLEPDIDFHCYQTASHIQLRGIRPPKTGDILTKVGAASGLTRARVTELTPYSLALSEREVPIHSIKLEPIDQSQHNQCICAPGDSGAVWFDEASRLAVALHFAGQANPFLGPVYARAALLTNIFTRLKICLNVTHNHG